MQVVADLGLYACFNMLVFDPDATLESLETNIDFMERYAHLPFNFGRAELYAGTPLLARMQAEGRARGDWLGWDYGLHDAAIQRVFELAMRLFYDRNFGPGALANRLQGTRFDVEVAASLHPEVWRPAWRREAEATSRALGENTAQTLRRILAFVRAEGGAADAEAFVAEQATNLRLADQAIRARAGALEDEVRRAVGARCQHARPRLPFSISGAAP